MTLSAAQRREAIVAATDIFSVIRDYLTLTPDHRGIERGLCPLHDDGDIVDPAFWVDRASRRWGCNACEAGGDVVDFVAQYEDIPESEAMGLLETRDDAVCRERRRVEAIWLARRDRGQGEES